MDNVTTAGHAPVGAHAHDAHAHHHEQSFVTKWIFSQDHKVIGIQYTITALLFLLFGFSLMALMRYQLAFPMQPIPVIGSLLGAANAPGGIMLPEFYNQLGAMHGTIMVFLGVVPLAVGGFGNYVMPLMIGAPDMAFPKLNMASYWVYFVGGVVIWLDMTQPDFERRLTAFSAQPKLVGVRPMIQDIEDSTWMLGPGVKRAFGVLQERGVCFDFLIRPHQLEPTLRILEEFPRLTREDIAAALEAEDARECEHSQLLAS